MDECELLSRSYLCQSVARSGAQHGFERAKLLVRGKEYLEDILRAKRDPANANPVVLSNDMPVLERIYGTIVYKQGFDRVLERHALSLRNGRLTTECMRFFALNAQGYDSAASICSGYSLN